MMSALRRLVVPIGVIAALLLFYLVNPWVNPDGSLLQAVTVAFWVASIVLVVALFEDRKDPASDEIEIEGPSFARFLFNNSRAGLLWLPIRIFVGFEWLDAGTHKLTGAGWLDGGSSLLGFWQSAVKIPDTGRPAITFEWYRGFLQILIDNHAQTWFSYVIVFGEIAVGVALVVGALTGVAAFFGAFMNMSFLLAGSASTNPVMFTLAVGLILAWKVAGYYGLDRYLLPMLGTPWRRGALFPRPQPRASAT